MKFIFVLFLCSRFFINFIHTEYVHAIKTITGNGEPPGGSRTYIFNAEFGDQQMSNSNHDRQKRSTNATKEAILSKVNHLKDRHKQLMVHWVGEGSNVIMCLARDPSPSSDIIPVNPSAVFISYDYGDTYENKTDSFKLADGNYSTLDKFYNHPKYNTHFVFTDLKHKLLYVTTNHGRNISRIELNFTASDVSFHELQPSTFLVHDKSDVRQCLWLTEDFGKNFRRIQEFVKSFYWVKDTNDNQQLLVHRLEPFGTGLIVYSDSLFKTRISHIYATRVIDLFIKGDYIFTTKLSAKGTLELYVSHKFGKYLRCIFDTQQDLKSYFVVDVTGNRALVAVSHTNTTSHLYVSDGLAGNDESIHFTLSLEDVLCYFPNNTWHDTFIHFLGEETFADVYKVEGLSGIYIASRIVKKITDTNIGPQNLGSVITFDHGATWRLIKAPRKDNEGQDIACDIHNNCSLHLSQKFSYLFPDTKTISILSSKSAPGILVATGVIGHSLKGHYGVYVSTDAGLTWRQALKELHFFNMGDHGGILTAVKYFKVRGQTRHILYSTDEGEIWKETPFHNEEIRLYGLMTEPGENTTVFTMFGSLQESHQWLIVKVDLLHSFEYNCTKEDYKTWSPSQSDGDRSYVPCIMGQQRTYKRRMSHSNCYNGEDFDTPISMEPCNCDILDYECDFGFVHNGKYGQCVRNKTVLIDPYKVPMICAQGQYYNRTKGYRKISGDMCVGGFEKHYLPDSVPCPFNEIQDFLLFAQRERILRLNLVTRTMEEVPVKNLRNVIAIDFDMKNNCVFWADVVLDTIGRQCLGNGSLPEILVSTDLASIEGMAFDWISNTLYFVDGMRSKIELIRTDISHNGRMRKTILGPETLKKPRGIALHPKHGFMYWTDWSSENPSVNRADLDGSNYKMLFGTPIVDWPNGISIDYIAERIYWVDARHDYIASSDLHGDDMKYVVSNNEVVSHPFAIAVFKSTMFWDDWKRVAIFSADKDSGNGNVLGLEILQQKLPGLMDLKVFAHGIQIGNNSCNPSTCPYLCVGSPNEVGHTCMCPDGMVKRNDQCLCPGNVRPFANMTCPKFNGTCRTDHFTCANGVCVPNGWRCDNEDDCGDNSDEDQCNAKTCPPNYFVCGNGKCLPHFWRCDYAADCTDGSDELNCPKQNCSKNQFTCANGRCIAAQWKCDGENDCRDGSDELDCSPPEPVTCKSDEFHCKAGGVTCIPITWICDGERDCRDNSDESNCKNNTCLDTIQFSCGPSDLCIYRTWVCDGEKDCADGRDELNCTSQKPTPGHKFNDPFIPENGTCHDWMYNCSNQKCIPYWWKCDGSDDCGDGSDEVGCPMVVTKTTTSTTSKPRTICLPNHFQCASDECIPQSWVCDGMSDCRDDEDETNCNGLSHCSLKQFRCHIDGSCISRESVCNHLFDCPDGSDEMNCDPKLPNIPEGPSCATGYFSCDSRCLPLNSLCDGQRDCPDGFDESNCTNTSRIYQILLMGVDGHGITESSLLLFWWVPIPNNLKLEFLPSISTVGDKVWSNKTWTDNSEYNFTNLQPYTIYNMTAYIRIKGSQVVFPPAKYFIASTEEAVPSEPWNVTATQMNGTDVLISWVEPAHPNGLICNYEIRWYTNPNVPPYRLKLSGNGTSHIMAVDFKHNVTYFFYIVAYNKIHESKMSEKAKLTFDGDSNLEPVDDFRISAKSNSSVDLAWNYKNPKEGFAISISAEMQEMQYPKILSRTTTSNNITIDKLSPGVTYTFKIRAYKKSFNGPETFLSAMTDGTPLPEITKIDSTLFRGTSVELTWNKPNDSRNVNWTYGIYYGIEEEQLFEKPRLETTKLRAVVSKLEACEIYRFSVGVTGPYGYGPLSRSSEDIPTLLNMAAPVKNVSVGPEMGNRMKMKVQWTPSCPIAIEMSYIIKVYERVKDQYWNVKTNSSIEQKLSYVFDVNQGGVYDVSVATAVQGAAYSPNVTYYGPPIRSPYELKVIIESNGSYIVYWQERDIASRNGSYKYEVQVSPGNTLKKENSQKFYVQGPPFIYTNFTSNMYTFVVQMKTDDGFSSIPSDEISIANEYHMSLEGSNLSTAVITVSVVIVILAVIIGVMFVRHRKLQKNFTRFTNSHYDTRSGAATFEDNGLEEDEAPQIQGFSDDEPLVIA